MVNAANVAITNLLDHLEKRPNFLAVNISTNRQTANNLFNEIFKTDLDMVVLVDDYVVALKNGTYTHIVNTRSINYTKVIKTNEEFDRFMCYSPFQEGLSKGFKFFASATKFVINYRYRIKKYAKLKENKTVVHEELNRNVKYILLKEGDVIYINFFHKYSLEESKNEG